MKKVLYTAAIIAVTSLHPLPAHAQDANDSAEAAVMNVINYDETSFQEGPAEYFTGNVEVGSQFSSGEMSDYMR